MICRVEFDRSAARAIKKLPKAFRVVLFKAARALGEDPHPPGHKPLHVPGFKHIYRIREGSYRIIYQVIDERLIIYVLHVGDRKDVYKNLLDLVRSRYVDPPS